MKDAKRGCLAGKLENNLDKKIGRAKVELLEGLLCYLWRGRGNNCNTYALRYYVNGKSRYVIVDPGQRIVASPLVDPKTGRIVDIYQEPSLDMLLRSMAGDGIQPSDIALIINTHGHVDHCEANLALLEKGKALIGIHEEDKALYVRTLGEIYGNQGIREEDLEPGFYLEDGELYLGKSSIITLKVLHTPGHSPGSVSLYWAEKKALIAGDLIFYRGVGRTDLPGGDTSALKGSILKLAELDLEYLLTGHPYGHPGVIRGKKAIEDNFRCVLSQLLV